MTVSDRSLRGINEEMMQLTEVTGDIEAAHSRADDLLIEAISWLAAGQGRATEDMARNLVGNWRQIEKWYA